MVTPTRDEIRAEALKNFMEESYRAGLKDIPTPEDDELKEGNYWLRAQRDLMTSPEAKATDELIEYLEYSASELEEVVVKSEDLKELLEASRKLEGIEARIKDLRRKRSKEKEEAKLRIAELERQLAEERAKVPPPPPPPPPSGLSKEQKTSLEDAFRRVFEEAGITRIPMASFRDELAGLQKDLKDVERTRAFDLAYRRIVDLARSILPPRPPPVVAPPPAPPAPPVVVVPPVELLGPRRRVIETVTCWVPGCWEPVSIDQDLMRRVTVVPVLKEISPRGPRYEPLLGFPPRFYWMCPGHREEKFGYRSIYDALAFLLFESSSSGKRLTVTKGTFVAIGLDGQDMRNIQAAEARWIPRS